jgi:hypothetical protein
LFRIAATAPRRLMLFSPNLPEQTEPFKETLINSPAPCRVFRRLAASKLITIAPLCLFASPCQSTKYLGSASGLFNQCLLDFQFKEVF